MAVAVEIDAVLDVARRQKLRLTDLTREGADQIVEPQIAALHDLQRREQLTLKKLGAAAIMRQRRERAEHRPLAHVALAEIRLQPPDRDDDLRRHAETLFDPRQQRSVLLHHEAAALDALGTDAGRDILLEGLVEGVALAAIELQHGGILGVA